MATISTASLAKPEASAILVVLSALAAKLTLVPALLALLGDRNWYFPRWMSWPPDVRIEGAFLSSSGQDAVAGLAR